VDNNYLDLGMNKSGFVHTLPGGRLTLRARNEARPQPGAMTMTYAAERLLLCRCKPATTTTPPR
jgi:hypothetical protein